MTKDKLSITLNELHKLFDNLNQEFFQSKLPECIITIQAKGNTGAYGWFTPSKVWNVGENNKHEINITSESLSRDYIDIAKTMLHEMVHLYCTTNGIKDTSRGNSYHNSKFKEESIKHGFYYKENSYDKKYGWTYSSLTEETIDKINNFKINKKVLTRINRKDIAAGGAPEPAKKSNIIKWTCGCGDIIRSSKADINAICGKCYTPFKMQVKEDN